MADAGTTPDVPVVIDGDVIVEFNEASSRQQINSGESVKTLFGKLKKFLTDLKAVAFSGAYSDLSGVPDLTQYASKSKYGDTTIDVGRLSGSTVGEYSTAEGMKTTASGQVSKASGYYTEALGDYSYSGGFFAKSIGHSSFAYGNRARTSKNNEVAFGIFNISNDDTLFSVGDGKADNGKHNAFEITTTGGKLHDKDIAVKDDIPTSLPANGGNADTVDGLRSDNFVKNTSDWTPMKFEVTYGDHNYPKTSIDDSIPIMPKACNYTFIVSRLKSDNSVKNIISIPTDYDDDVMLYQAGTGVWKNVADGGNADYAANAGNAEKLGGKDASAYSTSIIKSVTFSAATTDGYIWTGIPFPKYVIGVDLGHFDVIAQFCKGSNEATARAEWAMILVSKDDLTTPLNGSFNGIIYYVD